jgi:diacylglycerol kinase (ATP)
MAPRGFFGREAASFACALRGFGHLLRCEPHARFHLLATIAVLVLGAWLGLCGGEWVAVVLSAGLVWTAEALNTAIEQLADAVHPDRSPAIGRLKDIAAAAVFVAAITAASVGLIVFGPRLAALAGWGA